jgi:catechol 2,3-dioxygenase-like lactoylglutathione lyase family enzyme
MRSGGNDMKPLDSFEPFDSVHHVAIEVRSVSESVQWYVDRFRCHVEYQDETWALLSFANVKLALVTSGQHPPHLGFVTDDAVSYGNLRTHRDGTRSVYITDPSGNAVELIDELSVMTTVA